ncbi:MAG: hypothetical protein FWC35_05465, partial [Proteobacteria bacterium]|nr:hypothetical protein [Pseudomonadota bacterium]
QFLFIGSRFTLHASFPQSVTLMQLRFSSLVVTNSRRDFHPQEYAHAGRTGLRPSALSTLRTGLIRYVRNDAILLRGFA